MCVPMRSLAGPARPNARRLPIGSLLALTSPFTQALRRERLGRSLEDLGSIVAAGGAIRVGELGSGEPRPRLTGAQPAPARELTEADRQALARAEDKRARKRLKRALRALPALWKPAVAPAVIRKVRRDV